MTFFSASLTCAVLIACTSTATSLAAQEVVIGLGRSDYSSEGADNRMFGLLEYHAPPFGRWAGFDFGLGLAGTWDGSDDYFLGGGLVITRSFGDDRWFVELSEMPGYYHADDASHDLGDDFEFRSQIALGHHLSDDWAVSLAVAHISNAGLSERNPGVNFGLLRLHRRLGRR